MKNKTRIISLALSVMLFCSAFLADISLSAYAATSKGTVKVSDSLNVRSGPGTSYSVIGSLYNGDVVTIVGNSNDSSGTKWYKINFNSGYGYVSSSYITVTSSSSSSSTSQNSVYDDYKSFDEYLTAQKFPDSYKSALTALHKKYPSWVFVAQHIDLNWSTVLKEESKVGRSLVPSSSIASWKSFEQGAYDWTNKNWYGLDGSSWVAADSDIIAYCLDPRNFLTETQIFQFESLAYSKHHTTAGVNAILNGTFMSSSNKYPSSEYKTYADAFMAAAKVSGVSAYHLASRARQEQGVNGSALSDGYSIGGTKYYNFFNINAYTTSSGSAVYNGAKYASTTNSKYYLPWTTPYKSILGGAIFIGNGYITADQDTLYLQKFDVTDGGNGYYSHQYMTNILAPQSEAAAMKKAYSDEVLNSSIVFNIPVYKNMPSKACEKPTSTGDNNNLLSSLSINGYSLTPSFSRYTTSYELIVDSNVSSISVSAKASGSSAKVSGTGSKSLAYGDNTIKITVTAASGKTRTYTLSVYRKPESGSSGTNPVIGTKIYNVGTNITGVSPDTSISTFKTNLAVSNGTVKIFSGSTEKTSGKIATGYTVKIYKGSSVYKQYNVVIYGDVNGDGSISILDMIRLQKHILNISTLSGASKTAADTNKDGSLTILDMIRLQKHILNISKLSQ